MLDTIASVLSSGRKLVLLHGNADPDAVGSAYAIYRAAPDVTVAALGGLDKVSKIVCANLGFEVKETATVEDYDVVVALDTSSPDQLGADIFKAGQCVVIDHHARTSGWRDCIYYSDESKRSCSEIVFELLKVMRTPLDQKIGMALAAGMLTDSGHFRYSNPSMLRSFAEVMERTNISMDEVLSITDLEPDTSERVSQLKGAQRLRFERVGDLIVAISQGSAFESSVCKALLAIGADVAFVGSQRGEAYRLSARARPGVVRMGLHLGKLLERVGSDLSDQGGGHAGAAGLSGTGDVEAVLNMCLSNTMDFFRIRVRAHEK